MARATAQHIKIVVGAGQTGRPEWKPLMQTVGELAEWFMWMEQFELENGTQIHAYKHVLTRNYLHLTSTGQAYQYVASASLEEEVDGSCRLIPRSLAIRAAFRGYRELGGLMQHEIEEIEDLIHTARSYAERGELMPVDDAAFRRQREYDLAQLREFRDVLEPYGSAAS